MKAFTLIEVLIYTAITAVVGGLMVGILLTFSQVHQRESASTEVTGQLNFVTQTIGRLVRTASNIEITAGVSTSTIKLRMQDSTKDPTYISLVDGVIKLTEGTSAASDLTNSRVIINALNFKKFVQYPGHDTVSYDVQMTYNSQNPKAQVQRSLSSAIARVSAATFDSNLLPGNTTYEIGQVGSSWSRAYLNDGTAANPSYTFANNTGLGLFRAGANILGFTTAGAQRMTIDASGNVGIGTTGPNAKLTVGTAMSGTALGSTFISNAGALGTTATNELALANIGFTSGNQSSLGIRAYRTANGTDWTTSAIGLGMDVDNTVRAGASIWLNANGNVGIGTTAPNYQLHVTSTLGIGAAGLYQQQLSLGNNSIQSLNLGVGYTNMSLQALGGNVGIGTTDPGSYKLNVVGIGYGIRATANTAITGIGATIGGTGVYGSGGWAGVSGSGGQNGYGVYGTSVANYGVYCAGLNCGGSVAWTAASDIRLKENIVDLPTSDGLDAIMRLRPITFHWRDANLDQHKGEQLGLIAQEVQGIFPQLVVPGIASTTITLADGSTQVINNALAMDYSGFVVPIIKAIQEQQQQISPLYYGISIASGFGTSTPFISVNDLGNVGIGAAVPTSKLQVVGLPAYADNAAAKAGGLTAGAFYRTSTGVLMVVY